MNERKKGKEKERTTQLNTKRGEGIEKKERGPSCL